MKKLFLLCLATLCLASFAQQTKTENNDSNDWITERFGKTLVNAKGEKVSSSSLKGKIIGIYFSAHWCGPCRMFTPELVKFRNEQIKNKRKFEIVFISLDKSQKDMKSYMKETKMSWLALPFDSQKKREIQQKYHVGGIPTLIIIAPDGETITLRGRDDVTKSPKNAYAKWKNSK